MQSVLIQLPTSLLNMHFCFANKSFLTIFQKKKEKGRKEERKERVTKGSCYHDHYRQECVQLARETG
jgi:hypothetical protein